MGYTVKTIRQFKGLSQNLALTAGNPEFSLDCVNVIPSEAGVAKLRVPVTLSSEPVGENGPDQFAMYEGSSKSVMAFFGTDIYIFSLDDFIPALYDSNPDYAGPVPWSVILANDAAFMQNGASAPIKYTGGAVLAYWGIQKAQVPTLGAPTPTGITLAFGRKYRVAYKNEIRDVVGPASDASASTGPLSDEAQPVTIPAPVVFDPQIDTARLYATLDDGADYFFHSQHSGPFPIVISDTTPDDDLDQSERAPLINFQPPKCRYMCSWGSRIFMFGLTEESLKWVAYTGYNRIFVGRPEETCPQRNRLKLDTGADNIAGGGVMDAGVVVFDNSNKMFMFRGQPEDITVDAPVEFTLFMKPLPWNIGCAGHFTIQSTARGLVWLSSSFDVFLFNGSTEPVSIAQGVDPILRRINQQRAANSRSAYWQYKGRDWYVLAVCLGEDASDLNTLLIIDLEENQDKNVGCFPFNIGNFQSLGIVSMIDGSQKLVIGQGGNLKELKVTPTTVSGIEQNIESTSGTLGAYWRSGYFGNENPQEEKFFRWGRVTADQPIRVKRYLEQDNVTTPTPIEFVDVPIQGKVTTNKKGRRLSYELRFQDLDTPQNILEFTDVSIPVAVR